VDDDDDDDVNDKVHLGVIVAMKYDDDI